jgi:hypothetical protein
MVKTLRDYSVPAVANVPTAVNTRNGNFELRTGLIMSHPKISILRCDLENTKNKTKDFINLKNVPTLFMLSTF